MTIPDYQTLMRPLLAQLEDGQPRTMPQLRQGLSEYFQLTPEEQAEQFSSGRPVLRNRAGWARTYLHKAGLVSLPARGLCQITDLGVQALKDCPEQIGNRYLKQFPEFLDFIKRRKPEGDSDNDIQRVDDTVTPDEQLEAAYQMLNQELADNLLTMLKEGSPVFFEKVVVDLMLAMGYGGSRKDAGRATQATNDDGIDGIIKEDKLGLDVIYLQAKRWANTVHRPEIDKFIGSLTRNRARKGVFITTSSFSGGACEAVNTLDMKIVLIDGAQLAELMIEHNLGVARKDAYEVKAIDSDYFNEDE